LTLNSLLEGGHRTRFSAVAQLYLKHDDSLIAKASDKAETRNALHEHIDNLEATYPKLIANGIIRVETDIPRLGFAAWDAGRAVFIARSCFDSGFISEAGTWKVIEAARKLAKGAYKNWQDHAHSYIPSRAVWGGDTLALSAFVKVADYMLTDEDSPWVQRAWG
jgi:Protein of unknown function (DUF1266)